MKKIKSQNTGFIALITTIIISIILLTIITGVSAMSFGLRFNILNSELKTKSTRLAEACAETAILNLVQNSSYGGRETIFVKGSPCYICQVDTLGVNKVIYTQASSSNMYSNLKVQIEPTSGRVISWLETNSITISGGTCTILLQV
ncbi:MAG: hypothetical protein V4664_02650 [Patescibacteria group bacterium]